MSSSRCHGAAQSLDDPCLFVEPCAPREQARWDVMRMWHSGGAPSFSEQHYVGSTPPLGTTLLAKNILRMALQLSRVV